MYFVKHICCLNKILGGIKHKATLGTLQRQSN
jgi:hypothetical protein